ncbi:heme exporter protein CcmD [Agrobacterium vitis]
MKYAFYIGTAYGLTAAAILFMVVWIWLEGRARQKELKALEASGIRRRSDPSTEKAL